MGKKILVLCLDVIMIAFPAKYTVKDRISNTKLEKKRSLLHPNTAQGSFFPLQSDSKKTLKKKCPEKRSKIQTKCAPQIELIQYGRRIGKKVY